METYRERNLKPLYVPGVLVNSHGPFTWGKSPEDAVHNSVVLEEIGRMAASMEMFNKNTKSMQQELLDKHFLRKHGANAYYGQGNK